MKQEGGSGGGSARRMPAGPAHAGSLWLGAHHAGPPQLPKEAWLEIQLGPLWASCSPEWGCCPQAERRSSRASLVERPSGKDVAQASP